jgi:hypothetical protein
VKNLVSVSWSDHLTFGEGDGRLETPDALARRMRAWRDELGAGLLHWRIHRSRIPGRFSAARGYRHPSQTAGRGVTWDDFEAVPRLAHDAGLEAWLYVSLFDEGFPLAPPRVRVVSYHNAMHGQHVAWQSELTRRHPDWVTIDRTGRSRQWGVVSLAYPAARRAFIARWRALLRNTAFDGLFVCLRSQSRPADHADQFGYNEPVRREFRRRHGRDIRKETFDVQGWRDLSGEYLTTLLCEARGMLGGLKRRLSVGIPRGDVLGPPLGNTTLDWRTWLGHGIVDALVVDQTSSQCPSMWHQLWPMHRGDGYVQNYLDGRGLPPLEEHVAADYGPEAARAGARLFVARQWRERNGEEERSLLRIPHVTGLAFSSFRHDNPGAVRRADWHAGSVLEGQQGR